MASVGPIGRKLRRVLDVKSARGVSFALGAITVVGKPLGYARTLIIAWLFGTSPGMDAYHIASSIAGLLAGCATGAISGALLPEIERVRSRTGDLDGCRALVGAASVFSIAASIVIASLFFLIPERIIRLFASGFDSERIAWGAVMLAWIAPYSVIMIVRPIADVWAVFTERFTLSSITGLAFNIIAIPILLLSASHIGPSSVAFSLSVGSAVTYVMFVIGLSGFPVRLRASQIPRGSIARIAHNGAYSLTLSLMGAMYMVIDKYFASLLPSGTVASISYGGAAIMVLTQFANAPTSYLVARISRAISTDRDEAVRTAHTAMAACSAYFLPISAVLAFCARSITSVIYGWGSFGEESIAMTSIVIFAYSWGIIYSLMSNVLSSFAVAAQRMRTIVFLSAVGALVNTALNWLLVRRFGIMGLAAATSISQLLMFGVNMLVVLRESPFRSMWRMRLPHSYLLLAPLVAVCWATSHLGSVAQLAIAASALALHLYCVERLGLMPLLPEHWRPIGLARFLCTAAMSYLGRKA